MATWTRRQVLAQMGLAAAAVHTLDPHELCCTMAARAQTADKELFDLKKVGDGVYAAIAHPRYKPNCNGAVILTDDGVIVVDTHSKPSASRALYSQIQEISKKPVQTAFLLWLCREFCKRQPGCGPKFFFVIGDGPPWEMIELDPFSGEETDAFTLLHNWTDLWAVSGIAQIRARLRSLLNS